MSKRIIFSAKFMSTMYDNMWQFMNPDMIQHIFAQLGLPLRLTKKARVTDDKWKHGFEDSICFKGPASGGHYVYVDNSLQHHGTYEDKILTREEDDGVCHGVAIIYGLHEENGKFPLVTIPVEHRTREDYRKNYISILSLYLWLIQSGLWDNAMFDNFYNDVTWIMVNNRRTSIESQRAELTLINYIIHLHSI